MPGPGDRYATNRLGGKRIEKPSPPPTWKEFRMTIKSGWKTTEFWLVVASLAAKLTTWEDMPIEAFGTVMAYVLGRSVAKVRR